MAPFDVVDFEGLEGEGPGGMVRKVRRALGAREHDHAEAGQEEVYFVVRGSGTMRVDGEEIELKAGRFIRVDPAATRMPTSGPDGLEFVAVGAPLDAGYEPPSWVRSRTLVVRD